MENRSIYVGSYNPLYNEPTNAENDLVDTAGSDEPKDDKSHTENGDGGPTHEEVLMASSGGSAEEQVAQLEAVLRQKEEELAALHQQVADKAASGENERPEGSRTNNQNDPPLSVEAIQRMISEGVKAQYMQTHCSMSPGYVKPYPSEVDMVPFQIIIISHGSPNSMELGPHMSMWLTSWLPAKIHRIMVPFFHGSLCKHCQDKLSHGIVSWHPALSELGRKCKRPSSSAFIALNGRLESHS
jgi:hypothetical protein